MAKSTYTYRQITGMIVDLCKKYYRSMNFDSSTMRACIELTMVDFPTHVRGLFGSDLFVKEYQLVLSSTSGNIRIFSLVDIMKNIYGTMNLYGSVIGPIDIVSTSVFNGRTKSTEFDKQPVARIQEEYLYLYIGKLTSDEIGDLRLNAVVIPVVPSDELGYVEVPNQHVPLFIYWCAKKYLELDGKDIPAPIISGMKLTQGT